MRYRTLTVDQNQNQCLWGIVRLAKLRLTMTIANEAGQRYGASAEGYSECEIRWNSLWDNLIPVEVAIFTASGEFFRSKVATVCLTENGLNTLDLLLKTYHVENVRLDAIKDPQTRQICENLVATYPQLLEIVENAGVSEVDPVVRKAKPSGKTTGYAN